MRGAVGPQHLQSHPADVSLEISKEADHLPGVTSGGYHRELPSMALIATTKRRSISDA